MARLSSAALGVALGYAHLGVGEEGGNNEGPRIREFLANVDPPIETAAPWCAAFVQFAADLAADAMGVTNPLDGVRLEAYVQNYHDVLRAGEIDAEDVEPGDLVLFSFGGERWDHIGFVANPPNPEGFFKSVEGNTSAENERDGDAVALKRRSLSTGHRVTFIAWDREVA